MAKPVLQILSSAMKSWLLSDIAIVGDSWEAVW